MTMPKTSDHQHAAVESALRTLATGQEGLNALAESLQNGLATPFRKAVDTISAIRGRVISSSATRCGG